MQLFSELYSSSGPRTKVGATSLTALSSGCFATPPLWFAVPHWMYSTRWYWHWTAVSGVRNHCGVSWLHHFAGNGGWSSTSSLLVKASLEVSASKNLQQVITAHGDGSIIAVGQHGLVMRITCQRNGWITVGADACCCKTLEVHKRTDINRLPVIIAELVGVIITFYIAVQVIKIQFQLVAAVKIVNKCFPGCHTYESARISHCLYTPYQESVQLMQMR